MNAFSRTMLVFGLLMLILGAIGAIAIVGLKVGPYLEEKFFPVLGPVSHVETKLVGGKLQFRFAFIKNRGCRLQDMNWFQVSASGVSMPGYVIMVENDILVNRPTGENVTSWYQIMGVPPIPGIYLAALTYDCGFPWATPAQLGPGEVKLL